MNGQGWGPQYQFWLGPPEQAHVHVYDDAYTTADVVPVFSRYRHLSIFRKGTGGDPPTTLFSPWIMVLDRKHDNQIGAAEVEAAVMKLAHRVVAEHRFLKVWQYARAGAHNNHLTDDPLAVAKDATVIAKLWNEHTALLGNPFGLECSVTDENNKPVYTPSPEAAPFGDPVQLRRADPRQDRNVFTNELLTPRQVVVRERGRMLWPTGKFGSVGERTWGNSLRTIASHGINRAELFEKLKYRGVGE